MAIVGLVACSKQGATETAANKTPGNLQQSATLKGTYKSEEGFKNGFDLITYYPDGAYIESSHSINQDNGKTTTSFVRVGMCQQNGEQLDCRQTGSVNYEFNERDFQPTDVTTTELIKMDTNGNYRTKRIKWVVNGQPQPVENEWGGIYFPVHLDNQIEKENKMRQGIPAQFFR